VLLASSILAFSMLALHPSDLAAARLALGPPLASRVGALCGLYLLDRLTDQGRRPLPMLLVCVVLLVLGALESAMRLRVAGWPQATYEWGAPVMAVGTCILTAVLGYARYAHTAEAEGKGRGEEWASGKGFVRHWCLMLCGYVSIEAALRFGLMQADLRSALAPALGLCLESLLMMGMLLLLVRVEGGVAWLAKNGGGADEGDEGGSRLVVLPDRPALL
jgi:hypothetical protein